MSDEKQNTTTTNSTESHSFKEASIIILLACVSFGAGFFLVHISLPDQTRANSTEPCEASPQARHTRNTPHIDTDDVDSAETPTTASPSGDRIPEVPVGPTPDGIRINGAPLYLKCWDGDDTDGSDDCDRLRILERRMSNRLYVIENCKQMHAKNATGILSLGAQFDILNHEAKFWTGPSSEIDQAAQIGKCIRRELAGIPLNALNANHDRYRVFFTVDFFDIEAHQRELAKKRRQGRTVDVVKDRVNVRETPVDGASLGRISSDAKVTLLKRNKAQDWCHVLTPNDTEGWMICDALKL